MIYDQGLGLALGFMFAVVNRVRTRAKARLGLWLASSFWLELEPRSEAWVGSRPGLGYNWGSAFRVAVMVTGECF